MQNSFWRRELVIAVVALGFGIIALPLIVYWVGQQVIGEYAPNAAGMGFAETIWADLLDLDAAAWILVASPYLVVLLLRLIVRVWQRGASVSAVTDSRNRA